MDNITQDTGNNGKGSVKYAPLLGVTTSDIGSGKQKEKLIRSDMPTMGMEFVSIVDAGEIERVVVPTSRRIDEVLESAIKLIDEVLEVYDSEIERINIFSLFEEKIKSLWELREEGNKNFVDVLVLLEVAVRNSHYQNYQKSQYQSIKMILKKIKGVYITPYQTKECRKLLMDNGIDLFAPIRDWKNYTVEIKKNNATE